MDEGSLQVNGEARARPRDQQEYLDALREALVQAPQPQPAEDLPFAGGLVGVSGYDVVRLFEKTGLILLVTCTVLQILATLLGPTNILGLNVFDLHRKLFLLSLPLNMIFTSLSNIFVVIRAIPS